MVNYKVEFTLFLTSLNFDGKIKRTSSLYMIFNAFCKTKVSSIYTTDFPIVMCDTIKYEDNFNGYSCIEDLIERLTECPMSIEIIERDNIDCVKYNRAYFDSDVQTLTKLIDTIPKSLDRMRLIFTNTTGLKPDRKLFTLVLSTSARITCASAIRDCDWELSHSFRPVLHSTLHDNRGNYYSKYDPCNSKQTKYSYKQRDRNRSIPSCLDCCNDNLDNDGYNNISQSFPEPDPHRSFRSYFNYDRNEASLPNTSELLDPCSQKLSKMRYRDNAKQGPAFTSNHRPRSLCRDNDGYNTISRHFPEPDPHRSFRSCLNHNHDEASLPNTNELLDQCYRKLSKMRYRDNAKQEPALMSNRRSPSLLCECRTPNPCNDPPASFKLKKRSQSHARRCDMTSKNVDKCLEMEFRRLQKNVREVSEQVSSLIRVHKINSPAIIDDDKDSCRSYYENPVLDVPGRNRPDGFVRK